MPTCVEVARTLGRSIGFWDGDATLGPGAVGGDTLLLEAGAACTTPSQLTVHAVIWESALHAINGLLTGFRVDDTDFTADAPLLGPQYYCGALSPLTTTPRRRGVDTPYDRRPSATSPTDGVGSFARRATQSSACSKGSSQRPSG
jgi:hypothetical protein